MKIRLGHTENKNRKIVYEKIQYFKMKENVFRTK